MNGIWFYIIAILVGVANIGFLVWKLQICWKTTKYRQMPYKSIRSALAQVDSNKTALKPARHPARPAATGETSR